STLVTHDVECLRLLRIRGIAREQLREALDAGERIIDLVSDPAVQLPDRRESFRPLPPRFLRGEDAAVLEQHEGAERPSIDEGADAEAQPATPPGRLAGQGDTPGQHARAVALSPAFRFQLRQHLPEEVASHQLRAYRV